MASIEEIKDAIQNRKKLNVVHQTTNSDGSPMEGHAVQYREVVPVAVGHNSNTGNDLVRIYQYGGGTNKSESPGYKLLKLDHTLIEDAGDQNEASSHFNAHSSTLLSGFSANDSAFNQYYSMADDTSTWDSGVNLTSTMGDTGRASSRSSSNPFATNRFKQTRQKFSSRLIKSMRK